jgi:uncharacterized MAPEG superfamily protein
MTRDQKIVAVGAAGGVASMLLAMALLYRGLPAPDGLDSLADRIAFALRWDAVAAVPLLVMLAAVGNRRFLSEAIDPTRGAEDEATIINGRVADNTLQQFVLFSAAMLALATKLPPERMKIVAAAAIVFVAARTLFWIGYRIAPLYRAFGFAATAYLNVGLLVAALWLALA